MEAEFLRLHAHDGTEFLVDRRDWESEKTVEVADNLFYKNIPCLMSWRAYHKNHTTYIRATCQSRYDIRLHRMVMGAVKGQTIDHINNDGTDNRKGNLRVVTQQQNSMNRKPSGNRKYKGVYFNKQQGKYNAHIKYHSKKMHLGTFPTEIDAALAYDSAAAGLFGEFAVLNFPEHKSALLETK